MTEEILKGTIQPLSDIGIMITTYDKQEFKKWLNSVAFPICITLTCGNRLDIKREENFPFEDVPCSCGNPNHWFIKYEKGE